MIFGVPEAMINLAGMAVAAFLTLCVFSYLLGNNFLYRLALHILIGAGIAYAVVVALSTLYTHVWLRWPDAAAQDKEWKMGYLASGVALGVLLWLKLWRRTSGLGNISTGYLVGVGLGVAAGGALTGTLVAQSIATATPTAGIDPLAFFIGLLGTLTVLISFTFTATWRKRPWKVVSQFVRGLSAVGRFFLYVALGATFAGVYVASVSVLIGRVQFFVPLVVAALKYFGIE